MTHVYVIRHAKAKDREKWLEPDDLRPLTKAGLRQAKALPARFGDVPFWRLLSSPATRCVQTLEPLAEATGVAIEISDDLMEGSTAARALALALPLAADGPVAMCTHGDVLVDTLVELRSLGVPLGGALEWRKGSTWVLEVDGTDVRAGRYLEPPDVARKADER